MQLLDSPQKPQRKSNELVCSALSSCLLAALLITPPLAAGPTVVPTAEGQIGETPGAGEDTNGAVLEAFDRAIDEELMAATLTTPASPATPEFSFFTDVIHDVANPILLDSDTSPFTEVDKVTPSSARSRNVADDGDFVVFAFAVDGASPETLTVRIASFDEQGNGGIFSVVEDAPTFGLFLDPTLARTGVAVDNQGRVTVAYTEFAGGVPQVRAARLNAETGALIDPDFLVNGSVHGDPNVALLDPAGDRLIVPSFDFNDGNVKGNIVDFTGPSPVVGPEFLISDTLSDFGNINPVVSSDPALGTFVVAWENLTDQPGDPVNVRARRFDAMGNPIGGDFLVNSTTANAQGQADVACGSNGNCVIVWASDPINPTVPNDLDVFLQVYDANGNPIDGEIQVNPPDTAGVVQDRPAVRFLPELDTQGRPQFVVAWRDVGVPDGSSPNGTGVSYKCFAINQPIDEMPIFADGFESGDTSSWSTTQP